MSESVLEQLQALATRQSALLDTPCAHCTHAYLDHGGVSGDDRCWHPRVFRDGASPCRCRRFVDPTEVLEVVP